MDNTYGFSVSGDIGPYGNKIGAMVANIKAAASNIQRGTNPPYVVADFLNIFPQFRPELNENYEMIISMFIEMADASLQYRRWNSKWRYGMSLYVAHFYTLYLETIAGRNNTIGQVIANASPQFPKTAKSVGDVSVSFDVTTITNDLQGWGQWKSTTYGIQFASIAKLIGMGGCFVS